MDEFSGKAPAGSKELRVLHVCPLLTEASGWYAIVRGLSMAQRSAGCYSDICMAQGMMTLPGPVYSFGLWGPRRFSLSASLLRWAYSSQAASYDILHQHGIWNGFSIFTNLWRKKYQRPTVVAPQGSLERIALRCSRMKAKLALNLYERHNLEHASCLQATDIREAERFRYLGLNNPIAVIPNGVPEEWLQKSGNADRFFQTLELAQDKRTLLFFSRLHPKKGVELLLHALNRARMKLGRWQVVIAGPPSSLRYKTKLVEMAREMHLDQMIHFVGPLLGPIREDAFAAANLFVLPTRSDNYAIVVAEALGAGTPVITTEGALPWSVLNELGCGWWIPRRIPALVDALIEADELTDEELAAMGARGREWVAQEITWSSIAARTTELYEWLSRDATQPGFVIVD